MIKTKAMAWREVGSSPLAKKITAAVTAGAVARSIATVVAEMSGRRNELTAKKSPRPSIISMNPIPRMTFQASGFFSGAKIYGFPMESTSADLFNFKDFF